MEKNPQGLNIFLFLLNNVFLLLTAWTISATVIASLFGELNIYTWPILIQSLWEM